MTATPVIQVEHLRKSYGSTLAVEDVSLTVHRGEIVGILGPNGAGKTTTVECLAGLRDRDSGRVSVLGLDPARDRAALREVLGMQLQESELPARITAREAVELYASFYADPADPLELLDDLGLAERRDAQFRALSGGQKQRLSIALALVGNPQVAVLDELTTGLDPQARRDTWDVVRKVRDRGVTILLVTHLMEEAERLCDRIVLIDAGRVVATGTPAELAARSVGEHVLRFRSPEPGVTAVLAGVPGVHGFDGPDSGLGYEVRGGPELVQDVMVALSAAGVRANDVRLERATLEDAFLTLTGQDRPRDGAAGRRSRSRSLLTRSEA
jgi:ABC-2 type transport system ATP-binding protein